MGRTEGFPAPTCEVRLLARPLSPATATPCTCGNSTERSPSKEALQLAVLEEAGARFRQRVLTPALARPAGRERLLALFARYVDWMGDGCVYSTIAQEIGKLPEPVERAFRDGQRQ